MTFPLKSPACLSAYMTDILTYKQNGGYLSTRHFITVSSLTAVNSCPVLHLSVVTYFWSVVIIGLSTLMCLEKMSTAQADVRDIGDIALFIIPHIQTQLNRVCIFHVILL
jgi:hypothetical protein